MDRQLLVSLGYNNVANESELLVGFYLFSVWGYLNMIGMFKDQMFMRYEGITKISEKALRFGIENLTSYE